MARISRLPGIGRVVGAPIQLLVVRPGGATSDASVAELVATLNVVVARYAPDVELRVVAEIPAVLGRPVDDCRAPRVLVVRDGRVVGEAMGCTLPVRELDRVVRRAVVSPAACAS